MDYLGQKFGEQRWRHQGRRRLYTWDGLHGEVEVFNLRGKHLGAVDAISGVFKKHAEPGRSIDV
jgi:hypothetical protein